MPRKKLPKKTFVWTPSLAYAIGLITTDGCMSSDGRHISLTSSDIDQLRTFKNCLEIENKIGDVKNSDGVLSHRVEFGNVQLYNWLLTIGLTPKKTHTVGAIDVPNELFRDFLRGSLDGDGTITTYTDHFNTYKNPKYIYKRIFLRFLTASKTHIEWLQSMATKNLGVVGRIHKIKPAKPNNVPMYTLKFGKKESLKALSQMYYSNSAPCLKRKRQKYKNFINNRNQNNV